MKVKEGMLEQYGAGELSNRLFALDELNRREREASERKFKLLVSGTCALGMFCIVAALFGGSP